MVVYSKSNCPYCVKAKRLFEEEHISHVAYELDQQLQHGHPHLGRALYELTGEQTVPQIFVCGQFLGGPCQQPIVVSDAERLVDASFPF